MDPAAALDQFESTLRNQVAFVLEVATSSPAGGGPKWSEVLAQFSIQGVEPSQRGAVASQRRHNRGAFPEEVEAVLLALSHQAWAALQGLWGWAQSQPELAPRITAVGERVRTLSTDQRKAYEEGLRPKPVVGAGVAGIFANARATAQINPWGHLSYSDQLTLTCSGCGAPQQAELVFDCRFCGNSLFGPPAH